LQRNALERSIRAGVLAQTMAVKANSLSDVFRVLSGIRVSKFEYEPELRLFHLKIWLLSDDDDSSSLNDSAALFASIMLRRRIRLEHKRSPEATPSELIAQYSRSKLFESCMIWPSRIPALLIFFRSNSR
jgi:hypothetical protein